MTSIVLRTVFYVGMQPIWDWVSDLVTLCLENNNMNKCLNHMILVFEMICSYDYMFWK